MDSELHPGFCRRQTHCRFGEAGCEFGRIPDPLAFYPWLLLLRSSTESKIYGGRCVPFDEQKKSKVSMEHLIAQISERLHCALLQKKILLGPRKNKWQPERIAIAACLRCPCLVDDNEVSEVLKPLFHPSKCCASVASLSVSDNLNLSRKHMAP